MFRQHSSEIVFSFPDVSPDKAIQIAETFKIALLEKGVDGAHFRVACSDEEAMAIGGVLAFLGMAFLDAATKKVAEVVIDILIKKYNTVVVAKLSDGESWSYGDEYRKSGKPEQRLRQGVDYESLGLVILGASRFPRMAGLDNDAFARSAALIKKIFTPEYSLFKSIKVLDLFNADLSPAGIIEKIEEFIDIHRNIHDLMMYYCGHGGFLSDRSYFLTLHNTRAGGEATTALKVRDMRLDLQSRLINRRWYLVLDCCFAGEAVKEFMATDAREFVRSQMAEAMPPSGWAVLVAAPRNLPAMAPAGQPYTMFSGALADTLKAGTPHIRRHFSLADLADQTRKRIVEVHGFDRAVFPQSHAPMQNEGDLSRVPLFENKALDLADARADAPVEATGLRDIEQSFKSGFKEVRASALSAAYTLYCNGVGEIARNKIRSFLEEAQNDDSRQVSSLAREYINKIDHIETQTKHTYKVSFNRSRREDDIVAPTTPQSTDNFVAWLRDLPPGNPWLAFLAPAVPFVTIILTLWFMEIFLKGKTIESQDFAGSLFNLVVIIIISILAIRMRNILTGIHISLLLLFVSADLFCVFVGIVDIFERDTPRSQTLAAMFIPILLLADLCIINIRRKNASYVEIGIYASKIVIGIIGVGVILSK